MHHDSGVHTGAAAAAASVCNLLNRSVLTFGFVPFSQFVCCIDIWVNLLCSSPHSPVNIERISRHSAYALIRPDHFREKEKALVGLWHAGQAGKRSRCFPTSILSSTFQKVGCVARFDFTSNFEDMPIDIEQPLKSLNDAALIAMTVPTGWFHSSAALPHSVHLMTRPTKLNTCISHTPAGKGLRIVAADLPTTLPRSRHHNTARCFGHPTLDVQHPSSTAPRTGQQWSTCP